jgi:hypothetical protein
VNANLWGDLFWLIGFSVFFICVAAVCIAMIVTGYRGEDDD